MATRPFDVLRSLLFYPAFYVGTTLLLIVTTPFIFVGGPILREMIHSWCRLHRICRTIFLGIRVRIEGEVPSGPVLLAIKHESFFEAIELPLLVSMPAPFAKIELMRLPLWGRLGAIYGLIGVERDQGAKALRAMVAEARKRVADGRPLAIFPEGTRVPHGQRPELQSGFAGLYKLLGLPVVPVSLDSGPIYHRLWKRSGTITVRFGETIPAGLPRDEIETLVRDAINAQND